MDLDTLLGLLFFVFFIVLPLFSRGARGGKGKQGPNQQRGTGKPMTSGSSPSTPPAGGPTASTTPDQPSATLAEIRRRVEEAQRREQERARAAGPPKRTTASTAADASRPGGLVSSDPFEGGLVSVPGRRLDEIGQFEPTGLGREGGRARPEGQGPGQSPGQMGGPAGRTPGGLGRQGMAPASQPPRSAVIGSEGLIGREGRTLRRPEAGVLGREGAPVSSSGLPDTRAARRSARAAQAEIGSGERRRDGGRRVATDLGATLGRAEALQTDRKGIVNGLIWHEILSPPRALRNRRER